MSGADKLREKILAEAGSQARTVLDDGRKKAAEILDQGEKQAERQVKAIREAAQKKAEELRRRALTISALDARKKILAAKEGLIEETFTLAIERLCALDQKDYEELLYAMLLAASRTGAEEIIVAGADSVRFTAKLLERVNKELVVRGKQGRLALSPEVRDMQGGFVLRAGDVEINCSFDSILRMQRDKLETDVASILFS